MYAGKKQKKKQLGYEYKVWFETGGGEYII